ncbi:site-2 protease family protein [Paenibacillus pasadenensis]|uniref:Membrane metalloprotease n=1 Tax=Paenibacillus pasadenensis TaxID=217090 RepID=A0A2N5N899_9BACL|nr:MULTISPECIES: site-2 protease family protein [Paenibacillus]PLT46562.1 Membrane metalloprotease [Paenibacillus pasadenensis]QGG56959.1 site-2 protease family protein [Paenibacillus sp. B01]
MEGLQSLIRFPLDELPFIALVLIIAFTLHEFAHAYAAYKFGDDTAYKQGRVTLNPAVHLDFLGTFLILIAGFGWAKPVPVNPLNFKRPRLMNIVVALVGPLSNLVLMAVGAFLWQLFNSTDLLLGASDRVVEALSIFLHYFIYLNGMLFLFNLLPLPPLDGYRILYELLPRRTRIQLDQYSQWGILIFLLIVFIPALNRATLQPYLALVGDLHGMFRTWFEALF